jgi:putative hemolysin
MIDISKQITEHFPELKDDKKFSSKQAINVLRALVHEDEINGFIEQNKHLSGIDFLEEILEYFDFSYSISNKHREYIPSYGRSIIVSNHPIGSLDGLALLKLACEIRPDAKILVNQLLYAIEPLRDFFIPLDNMTKKNNYKQVYSEVIDHLEQEGLVILFPAGEVSRFSIKGIKDGKWKSGFLHFAEKTKSPIIPIHSKARNSFLFYSVSSIYKPAATALLSNEMFNKNNQVIQFKVGKPINLKKVMDLGLKRKEVAKLIRKQVYLISKKKKNKKELLPTDVPIIHPIDKKGIRKELRNSKILGETNDGKIIYLVNYSDSPKVLKEIARLRELSFRMVDEGTGKRFDIDTYDRFYKHVVLWDEFDLEIVGAYRIGECDQILKEIGTDGLYTKSLFDFSEEFESKLESAIELGRSFIQPRYWGLRGLDYLWYGIGAYLLENPKYKYMFGPVSLSDSYPKESKELIVGFYKEQFGGSDTLVSAKIPFEINREFSDFSGDYKESFKKLNDQLSELGVKLPTLYKQYTELCNEDGSEFLDFNIDKDFGNCVDGLIFVKIELIKEKKKQRYIYSHKKLIQDSAA